MKIRKLYIRGFGKLEDFELELSKGINIIYGPNESGKSTLMAFVKAALYGLKGGRADKEGLAAELKRFKPWNCAKYGGYMNLELDKAGSFRLERDFSSNSVKLYDQDFNEVTGIFSGKDGKGIGEKLTGINESLFDKTVYIRQLGTKIDTSASKDLIDRISNLGQGGYEDISYKKAHSVLKEALKQQVGTDRSYTRPLDIITRRLDELAHTSAKIREDESSRILTRERLAQLSAEIAFLTNKEELADRAVEFSELKEKLDIQKNKHEEVRFLSEGIKALQKNINKMTEDKLALEPEEKQLADQESKLLHHMSQIQGQDIESKLDSLKKQVKTLDVVGITALIALLGTVWGSIILNRLPVYVTAIPALTAIVSSIIRIGRARSLKEVENDRAELELKEEQASKSLENVRKVRGIISQQAGALADRLTAEKTQLEQQSGRLAAVSLNFNQADLGELERRADLLSENIIQLLETLTPDLPKTETILFENTLENSTESQKAELTRLRQSYIEQLQLKKIEKAQLEFQLQRNCTAFDAEAVEQESERLTQQKKALEQRGEALQIAMKTLEEASYEVQKKFLPVMNKVFSSTFSGLTTQKYSDTRAGDNLNIMLSDSASETVVPVSALSNGTMDQLYLALRIAISETVLKGGESLPLFMDEPFAQYDDERTVNALNRIIALGKNQQIIIFTCKQREVELISSLNSIDACKICSLT